MKLQLEGLVEDDLDIVEPGWEEASELKQFEVDWDLEEEDDINQRTRSILIHKDNWLRRRSMRKINEQKARKSPKKNSFFEPLTFDIPILSPIIGSLSTPNRQKRTLSLAQNMTPRTRSKTKSEALMQQEIQKEKEMDQGQGLGNGFSFSNNLDGDVQLIEAPMIDFLKFMTPTKEAQGISTTPIIPSWLSNLASKKRNLQTMTTLVKDIATNMQPTTLRSRN